MGPRTRAALDRFISAAKLAANTPIDEALIGQIKGVATERARQVAEAKAKEQAPVEEARLKAEREQLAAQQRAEAEERARQAAAEAEAQRLASERKQREAERMRAEAEAAERARLQIVAEAERQANAEREREQAEAKRIEAENRQLQQNEAATALTQQLAQTKSEPRPKAAGTNSSPSRIALVIGNGAYSHAPSLPNPRNDAADITALLSRMGFTVMDGTDLGRDAMEELMIRFAKAEIALAFYAGHGIQVEGTNYLIPVDADIEDELDLRRLIRLDDMVRDAGRADRFGLVMVDACRDNPFEAVLARSLGSASRSTGPMRGLAAPVVPPRVLVAYATAATQTAADGNGRNSPFTAAVLKHLSDPEDVRIVMGRIVDAVSEASQQRQRPDSWNSLGGERILLVKPEAVAEALDVQLTLAEQGRATLANSSRPLCRRRGWQVQPDSSTVDPPLPGAIRRRRYGLI
jgi:hypothetical protein